VLKPIFDFDYWGLPIYWIMLAVGFLFAFGSLRKKQQATWCSPGVKSKTRWVFLLTTAVSLGCANIIGWILHPEYLRLPIADRFMVAGFSFYYGALAFLGASALLLRIMQLDMKFWVDHIVPSILIVNIFGRIGCSLAGCCYGADITIFGSSVAFPARELEAIAALIMLIVFSKAVKQHRAFWFLSSYSVLRFLLEFGRADDRGFLFISWLSPAQVTSVLVWIGLAAYVVIMKFALHKNPFEKYNEFEIWNSLASQPYKPKRHGGLKKLLAFVLIGTFALAIWNPLQITSLDSAKQSMLNVFSWVGATRSQVDVIATSTGTSAQELNRETVASKEDALAIVRNADPEVGGVFEVHSQEQLANGNQLYTAHQMYRGKPILNSGRQVVVAPNNSASYMVGESIPLSGANRTREGSATNKSGPQVIKEIFGENITVKSTTEGYYYDPGTLKGDTLRNVDQVVFELAHGTILSALIDRGSGDIVTLGPDNQGANYNAALSSIMQATEAFLDPQKAVDTTGLHSDLQALNNTFAAISNNRNIEDKAFADILESSLVVTQGLATPNLSLYRDVLLRECKSYYVNHGQREREAQRRTNTVDQALRQAGIRQIEDNPVASVVMADTTVKTNGSINYPGNSNAMVLTADAGRAQTFTISTNAPVIITVMDEADLPILSMSVERNETLRIFPTDGNETLHIVVSDDPLAPGLGVYSITIQPDRVAKQRERVPGYITTKLGQIESAYNRSNVSRFVRLLHFTESGDNSWATSIGMTALAGLSSYTVKNCYGCVGLDQELLDGDKMMIVQFLTLKNGVPNIPQEIAEALKDTYLTMRYERHVEHANGSYVKATMEIRMLDALDAPPILKHTVYMEIRHIDNEEIAQQAVQALDITNDWLRQTLPKLFSGYYICDDFNSDRVRRGLGVSDEELAQDAAASFNLYRFWNDKPVKAGGREIWLKEFPRAAVAVFGHWSAEELNAFEKFTLHYNIGILKTEIRKLEWENRLHSTIPGLVATGKDIWDLVTDPIGFAGGAIFGDWWALIDLKGVIEDHVFDAMLDDMRMNAIKQIRQNKADIAAIHALLREMDPNYPEYGIAIDAGEEETTPGNTETRKGKLVFFQHGLSDSKNCWAQATCSLAVDHPNEMVSIGIPLTQRDSYYASRSAELLSDVKKLVNSGKTVLISTEFSTGYLSFADQLSEMHIMVDPFLALDAEIVLIGHSMGGLASINYALDCAKQYPSRSIRVITADTPYQPNWYARAVWNNKAGYVGILAGQQRGEAHRDLGGLPYSGKNKIDGTGAMADLRNRWNSYSGGNIHVYAIPVSMYTVYDKTKNDEKRNKNGEKLWNKIGDGIVDIPAQQGKKLHKGDVEWKNIDVQDMIIGEDVSPYTKAAKVGAMGAIHAPIDDAAKVKHPYHHVNSHDRDEMIDQIYDLLIK